VVDQVMIIFAGAKGYLDKVERRHVAAWESQFLQFMRDQRPEVRNGLLKDRKFSPDLEGKLKQAIEYFQPQFKKPA
jgi:F-type H+/Na+-transporting ATPase subunit alpha